MGPPVPTPRQIPPASPRFQRVGRMAPQRRQVGRNRPRTPPKPELVHEMLEGTPGTLGQPSDGVRGEFFEQRFKSVAILDEESLLATCAYIDLNPVAAGIAETPRTSSEYLRFHARRTRQGPGPNRQTCKPLPRASTAAPRRSAGLEKSIWLCPIEDRSRLESLVEECSKASRWDTTCFWSTTPAASSAKAKPRSRPSWRESWNDWAAAPIAGEPGLRNSRPAACSADFSQPLAPAARGRHSTGRAPPRQSGRLPGKLKNLHYPALPRV